MKKQKINLIGGGFRHSLSTDPFSSPNMIEWVLDKSADISIHVDGGLYYEVDNRKENYGWLAESSAIIPGIIRNVFNNLSVYKSRFKYIFTQDRRLVELDPSFIKFSSPHMVPWIQNWSIYNKTKLISFIGSNKTMCPGHKLRQKKIKELYKKVDHFGRGFGNRELPWEIEVNSRKESGKILGLKDYMFSIAMENDNYDEVISQKVTDCIATGTIPIYWGSRNITNYFDKRGIVFLEDLCNIEHLTEELYFSKMEFVEKNLRLLDNLLLSEDCIYLKYLQGK